MDIHPLDGTIVPEDDSETWTVEIPLVFSRVSTGPKGILQFTLESRDPAVRFFGEQTVHGFRPSARRVATIDKITSRPINFRDEEEGSNRLVFVTQGRLAPDHTELPTRLSLEVKLTLSNNGFVRIPLDATHTDGRLQFQMKHPATLDRVLPIVNLGVIGLGIYLLHSILLPDLDRLHPSEPNEPWFLSKARLQTGLGILLSFLGMSIGRLRALFSFVGNPQGVYKWPELHFEPGILRHLRSPLMAIALAALLVAEVGLIYEVSSPIPQLPPGTFLSDGTHRLDPNGEKKFTLRRGRRDAFRIYCGSGAHPIGELDGRDVQLRDLSVARQRAQDKGSGDMSIDDVLRECSASTDPPNLHCEIKALICDGEDHPRHSLTISDHNGDFSIRLRDSPPYAFTDLVGLANRFRDDVLRNIGTLELFTRQQSLAIRFYDQLYAETSDKVVDHDDMIAATIGLLEEIRDGNIKARIERVILCKGLLLFVESEPDRLGGVLPSDAGARIAEAFGKAAKERYLDTPEFMAIAELAVALMMSPMVEGHHGALHDAVVAKIPPGGTMRTVGILRYARAFVIANGVALHNAAPQFCYFASLQSELARWNRRFRKALHDPQIADPDGAVRELTDMEQARLTKRADSVWSSCHAES